MRTVTLVAFAGALGLGPPSPSAQDPVISRGEPAALTGEIVEISCFQPRRQQFVFKVDLPATWPKGKDLVWTLTANGTTLKAFGSLWPVWEIDEHTISANRGSRTAVDFDEPPNEAPRIVDAPAHQTVATGQAVTLTVTVADDGRPAPRADRGARVAGIKRAGAGTAADDGLPPLNQSLRVSWVQWRGPGRARFDPAVASVADGKATTIVTFDGPGVYLLRAYAEDARVFTTRDVKVTVTASASPTGW